MTNNKKKRKNNGFTLVELIVVIVILAILAAILVPALLGYIDKSKNQKVFLDARNCMVAAQSMLSQYYAEGKTVSEYDGKYMLVEGEFAEEVLRIADLPSGYEYIAFGCSEKMKNSDGSLNRKGYTINFFSYTENGQEVYYSNGEWNTGNWSKEDEEQAKYQYTIYAPGISDVGNLYEDPSVEQVQE